MAAAHAERSAPPLTIVLCYRPQADTDRECQLERILAHMDTVLPEGTVAYVVEQSDDGRPFNRGQLLNEGIVRSLAEFPTSPVCVHDVDLLPDGELGGRYGDCARLATEGKGPYHLAACYERYAGPGYFGGVVLMGPEHWEACNGFPNTFWGWGGEDDALLARARRCGLCPVAVAGNLTDLERDARGQPMDAAAKQAQLRARGATCHDRRERVAIDASAWRLDGIGWLRQNRPAQVATRNLATRRVRGFHHVVRLCEPPDPINPAHPTAPRAPVADVPARRATGTRLAAARAAGPL